MIKTALRFWLVLISLISLAFSCSQSNFEILNSQEYTLRNQGDYQSYLALEYLEFARRLKLAEDEKTAEYFSEKGLAISSGEQFIPENPLNWNSDQMQLEELTITQKRLEALLEWTELAQKLPIQLAHLSYLYDCWVSKESQADFRESGDTSCRYTYGALLKEIENYANNFNKKKSIKPIIKAPEFTRFEITFEEESFDLNDQANREIIRVIKYINSIRENYLVYLAGNGDNAAKSLKNTTLATNRIKAVKNYLAKNGIPEEVINLDNQGESYPDTISIDSNQFFNSRSVGLYVIRGEGKIPSYPMPLLQNLFYRQQIKDAQVERGF